MSVSPCADGATLDLRGLRCPLPVLRTRKLLAGLPPGACATVLADDPLAAIDLPNYLRESGDHLLESTVVGSARAFVIRRGTAIPAPDEEDA